MRRTSMVPVACITAPFSARLLPWTPPLFWSVVLTPSCNLYSQQVLLCPWQTTSTSATSARRTRCGPSARPPTCRRAGGGGPGPPGGPPPAPERRPAIPLDDFRPCDESGDVDVRRYAPSRVDVGALRRRALFIVQAWVLEHGAVEGALPERLCRVISDMVHAHCRAVQRAETSPDGKVSFSTRDDLGEV